MKKESFELSNYQKAIINYVRSQRGNLLVDAKAGAGKTSTLLLIADEISKQNKKCLFLAFNKHIADEISSKINNPNHCMSKTIHSLGLSFIRSYLYRKHQTNYDLVINTDKLREIVKDQYSKLCYDIIQQNYEKDLSAEDLKSLHSNLISDLVLLCNFSRFYNINYKLNNSLKPLIFRFCWNLGDYLSDIPNYQQVVINSLDYTKYLFENPKVDENNTPIYEIDYVDMIYFPVYYNMYVPFGIKPYLDYILCDECQDVSILQQKFLQQLKTDNNRYIFVGDQKQAIYGFAGADTNSINNLKKNFVLKELPLNICYRCPESVIRITQDIVPEIEWNPTREDKGNVELIEYKSLKDILQDGDIIIGRKNRDLVKIYRNFVLHQHRKVKFRNTELVNSLVNDMEYVIKEYIRLYNKYLNVDKQVHTYMDHYKKENKSYTDEQLQNEKEFAIKQAITNNMNLQKPISRSKYNIDYLQTCMKEYKEEGAYEYETDNKQTEYFEIIESFIDDYKKVNSSILVTDFIKYLKSFLTKGLNDNVPIISSIHAMKGGEADNIFIYDYPRFPYSFGRQGDDEKQQETNLQYVALTRAKKNLYLIKITPGNEDDDQLNINCEYNINKLLQPMEQKI